MRYGKGTILARGKKLTVFWDARPSRVWVYEPTAAHPAGEVMDGSGWGAQWKGQLVVMWPDADRVEIEVVVLRPSSQPQWCEVEKFHKERVRRKRQAPRRKP